MRWNIFITLLQKEALRHLANRGGMVMILLPVVAAAALAFIAKGKGLGPISSGRAECCYLDYWHDGPWIEHLRQNIPPELAPHLQFRAVEHVAAAGETITYPSGAGSIQVRSGGDGLSSAGGKVWIWHPGTDAAALASYEAWFWQETARYFRQRALQAQGPGSSPAGIASIAALEVERSTLAGSLDARSTTATALVLFAVFFTCVYLLPSWTCEERERGLLLAVALSPATPLEIVTARGVFYAALGIGLATMVAGISCPEVLGQPFFWAALAVTALGASAVGLTIACVARTQRMASLGALAYTLTIALLLVVGQAAGLSALGWLTMEYHNPRMLHAALSGSIEGQHGGNLAAAAVLAVAWLAVATSLFRRRGWQ